MMRLCLFQLKTQRADYLRLRGEASRAELRLYVTAFIMRLAFAFTWLALTLLRRKADRLAPGMIDSGVLAALLLIAMNPDAVIVRTNIKRSLGDQKLDAAYVASLSADALPALIKLLPTLPEAEREKVAPELRRRWSSESFEDWRSFSWGRYQGEKALKVGGILEAE